MDSLKTSLAIPLEQTPFVMRAIGFYPSELEVVYACLCVSDDWIVLYM